MSRAAELPGQFRPRLTLQTLTRGDGLLGMKPSGAFGPRGSSVTVFSQFTAMLGLIETELDALQLPWLALTGKTSPAQRGVLVAQFQSESVPIMRRHCPRKTRKARKNRANESCRNNYPMLKQALDACSIQLWVYFLCQ